jgi:uncharacterized protein (DUF58 family)
MRKFFLELMKRRGQIYILPTRMGAYLNGLIFLMFLLAVGYSNNLLLIFTLFLFGFNLVWLVQTHLHLHRYQLSTFQLENGHANSLATYRMSWKTEPSAPLAASFQLHTDDEVLLNRGSHLLGVFHLTHRGPKNFRYLKIVSENPFGLYRVWKYIKISGTSYVYPSILEGLNLNLVALKGLDGETGGGTRGVGDIQGLLPYQNDESRKISWKQYARTGDLLIKDQEEQAIHILHLEYNDQEINRERHLSELATQMVQCYRHDFSFSFSILGRYYPPAHHRTHLDQCLKELCLC